MPDLSGHFYVLKFNSCSLAPGMIFASADLNRLLLPPICQ